MDEPIIDTFLLIDHVDQILKGVSETYAKSFNGKNAPIIIASNNPASLRVDPRGGLFNGVTYLFKAAAKQVQSISEANPGIEILPVDISYRPAKNSSDNIDDVRLLFHAETGRPQAFDAWKTCIRSCLESFIDDVKLGWTVSEEDGHKWYENKYDGLVLGTVGLLSLSIIAFGEYKSFYNTDEKRWIATLPTPGKTDNGIKLREDVMGRFLRPTGFCQQDLILNLQSLLKSAPMTNDEKIRSKYN